MNKQAWAIAVGVVMVIAGVVLFIAFQDVETSVIGLRQVGLVIAVLGAIEIAVTGWSMLGSRRQHDR